MTPHSESWELLGTCTLALSSQCVVVQFHAHERDSAHNNPCIAWHTERLVRSRFYPGELTLEPANTIRLSVYRRTIYLFSGWVQKTEMAVSRQCGSHRPPAMEAGAGREFVREIEEITRVYKNKCIPISYCGG